MTPLEIGIAAGCVKTAFSIVQHAIGKRADIGRDLVKSSMLGAAVGAVVKFAPRLLVPGFA